MGIRGHLQTRQPEYNGACISSQIQSAAYQYLIERKLSVWTNGEGEYSEHWEIDISSVDRVRDTAKRLRESPSVFDDYLPQEMRGLGRATALADLLDDGLEIAQQNHYDTIGVDWF